MKIFLESSFAFLSRYGIEFFKEAESAPLIHCRLREDKHTKEK
jgi:hypothetical protein